MYMYMYMYMYVYMYEAVCPQIFITEISIAKFRD